MQAAKPQWPADDCYHGCCNGEKPPTSPAVYNARKEGSGSGKKAAAATKSADKVTHFFKLRLCSFGAILYCSSAAILLSTSDVLAITLSIVRL
jgi:hypothetical protein